LGFWGFGPKTPKPLIRKS